VDHPKAGAFQVPGPPYKMSGASQLPLAPAPLLGQHNDEVFCGELGVEKKELPGLRRSGVI
ncbi:MAG: formyl-CoA transferase, partial [Chloroflexi bacterium]|nr:formyl-CoA transferase [Chloroflexota bacterium]